MNIQAEHTHPSLALAPLTCRLLLGALVAGLGGEIAAARPAQAVGVQTVGPIAPARRTVAQSAPGLATPIRTNPSGDPVLETLQSFGVATGQTPRLDEQGHALDDGHAPLGGTVELGRRDELVIVGLLQNGDDLARTFWVWQDGAAGPDPWGSYESELLYSMGTLEMNDESPPTASGAAPQSSRAVAAADVDGDGIEEILVLHRQGAELLLRVIDDQDAGFTTTEQQLAYEPLIISDVAIGAGDFDGDGVAEVAAAWCVDGVGVTLAFFDGSAGTFQLASQVDLVPELFGSAFSLMLEVGNVDNDARLEVALIVDENADPEGLCRWFLYDDLNAQTALLAGGPLTSTFQSLTRTALVGDVALGDIDGDGRDEVLLAGLTAFTHGCEQPDYLVLALDDAEHGFASLGTKHFHHDYVTSCGTGTKMVRWAHINAGDFDGDGRDEIQMNQFIYDDWIDGGAWNEAWTLPNNVVMSGGSSQYFDRSTSAFAVGDYTGNGRADIVTARNAVVTDDVTVYSYGAGGFVQSGHFNTHGGYNYLWTNPLLLTVNVDADTAVLSHAELEYRFVFTEPIVIAALAAPPYEAGIDQNYEACSTAFGNTTSSGTTEERTVSLSAGVSVGIDIDPGLFLPALEISASLSIEASNTTAHSYQLERTVLFQSGWDEDLVVFTTIPMDIYTYTVVSHEDPAMVGASFEMRYPRSPIVLQADRAYYNEHLLDGGMQVDESVFQHSIGDVSSYPNVLQKNQLLANGGLEIGPQSVGQGSGSTQVTLQVSDEWSDTGALAMGFELEVKASGGGVMAGFTVGGSIEDALTITSGTQTTYTGTVGAIGAADFADHAYSFGLFTYVYDEPSRGYQFEVLNYWRE